VKKGRKQENEENKIDIEKHGNMYG